MALIKCSECGKEISSKATTCPNCGCPNNIKSKELFKEKEYKELTKEEKKELFNIMKNKKVYPSTWMVLCTLSGILFFIFMFLSIFNFAFLIAMLIAFILTFAFSYFGVKEIKEYYYKNIK